LLDMRIILKLVCLFVYLSVNCFPPREDKGWGGQRGIDGGAGLLRRTRREKTIPTTSMAMSEPLKYPLDD
jgi:hypothetical protein